ncbi:PAS domain S-box protein [Ancylothrix sp. C2]|uniref:PAS domain-containing sensor histidine kinase n=1 Tax=Ancylothrix sp. D3o TaxID=2953691 RepID=UPI0021BA5422|nr:PAS domain S-box protein [Ancylothrix sp. D3o]MCT7951740.1 PAS domain S-box protein [Ancylothrix sp. D3o]
MTSQSPKTSNLKFDSKHEKILKGKRLQLLNLIEAELSELYLFDTETLCCNYASAEALRNLGYSCEQMRNMTLFAMQPELDEKYFRQIIDFLQKNPQEKIELQTQQRRADGSIYPVKIRWQLIHQGKKYTLVALVQDMTDVEQRNAELKNMIERLKTEIAERKQADQKLKKTQILLNSILENMPIGVCLKEAKDLSISFWNKALEEISGVSEQQVKGKTDFDLFSREEAEFFTGKDREALAHNQLIDIPEETMQTSHKGLRILHTKKVPIYNEAGEAQYLLCLIEDITERKRTEEELSKNHLILRSVIDTTPDVVFVKDTQGRYVLGNLAVANWLKKPLSEIVGKHDNQLWPAPIAQQIIQGDETVINAGKLLVYEENIPDNQILRTIQTRKYPWLDANGNIIGLIGICRDITDSKQAEKTIQESEERYRSLVQATSQMVWITDANGQTIDIPAWRTYTGQTLEELRGLGWLNAVHPDDRERTALVWAEAVRNKTLFDIEYRIRAADGTYRFFSVRGVPVVAEDGSIREWVGVCVDIDDRKQAEEELRNSEAQLRLQTQQLEQTLRQLQQTQTQLIQSEKMSSLGQLVAGVAHEINNPVSFIYGNIQPASDYIQELLTLIELYQKNYPKPTTEIEKFADQIDVDFVMEDLPKLLASMRMGAQRIKEIVLSLRNFSRLDEAEMKPVNLHEGIDNTLMILQNRLKETAGNPEIQVIKNYGKLPEVECYAGSLNQVFMNLITNAIDAIENQPKPRIITIETKLCSALDCAVIRIADNGSGMPEGVRTRLFDPFFTTKPVGKGTGLGLAISYQIVVEKHKGNIRCISSPGKGAEFIIKIPLQQKQ